MMGRSLSITLVILMRTATCPAQPVDLTAIEAIGSCQSGTHYEKEKYRVGRIAINTPYDVLHLRFLSGLKPRIEETLAIREGQDFVYSKVFRASEQIEETALATPPIGVPIAGSIVLTRAVNCREVEGRKVVDLEYYFIPARVPSFAAYSFESREKETTDPARPAGLAPRRFAFSPRAGYSNTARLFGGGRMEFNRNKGPVKAFSLEGVRSARLRDINAAFSGSAFLAKPMMQLADYTAAYEFRDEPAGNDRIRRAQVTGEFRAASRPLGATGWVLRYGASLGGGYRQSDLNSGLADRGLLANSGYGGLKAFAGATVRTASQSLTASYGILAGRNGNGGAVDYRKHLVDIAHSWRRVRNHRPLEIETRLNAGLVGKACGNVESCGIPIAERFFGGNIEHNFLANSDWVIRSQPLLRSMPLNALTNTLTGRAFGGDRFWASNVTVAYAVFRKTLVPEALLSQPDFMQRIDATPTTAKGLLASAYANLDPKFANDPGLEPARVELALIRKIVEDITPAWDALAASIPPERREEYDRCTDDHIGQILLDIEDVEARKISINLLGNRTSNLQKSASCLEAFSAGAGDGLSSASKALGEARKRIEAVIESTDTFKRASLKAAEDMVLAERTIKTLFHEVNLFSVSPVLAFDVAQIGPRVGGLPARRYGIGAGVRFSVASTLNLTIGYARNAQHRANEPRGAVFFALDVIDLFR